jgi:hypothetical protein
MQTVEVVSLFTSKFQWLLNDDFDILPPGNIPSGLVFPQSRHARLLVGLMRRVVYHGVMIDLVGGFLQLNHQDRILRRLSSLAQGILKAGMD